MKTNCSDTLVPQPSGFEAFGQAVSAWQDRLTAGLSRSIRASDQTMGHMEEEILHRTREVERVALEEAAQTKADQAPPECPICGGSGTSK